MVTVAASSWPRASQPDLPVDTDVDTTARADVLDGMTLSASPATALSINRRRTPRDAASPGLTCRQRHRMAGTHVAIPTGSDR
jgi:hypothetical protein